MLANVRLDHFKAGRFGHLDGAEVFEVVCLQRCLYVVGHVIAVELDRVGLDQKSINRIRQNVVEPKPPGQQEDHQKTNGRLEALADIGPINPAHRRRHQGDH